MNKDEARSAVWAELVKVAKPDSRFHLDFAEYIPDFVGSEKATRRLTAMDIYRRAQTVFITPDNCVEALRAQTVRDGKVQIMTTYGIRRGFVELRPEDVAPGMEEYAVLLDVIEEMGRYITLDELKRCYHLDLIVTGASAVSRDGIRFGKGHGFFDLEWAMLYQLGVVDLRTPIVAFVHDSQVVDIELEASGFDTVCDFIVTPTQMIRVESPRKPVKGVIWAQLEPDMLAQIPPLRELKKMEEAGLVTAGGQKEVPMK